MNNFEIIILALALVFNSWNEYRNAGISLAKEPAIRRFYYAAITFLLQFTMAGTGIWAGNKAGSFELRTNMLISLCIMLLIGLKVILTGFKSQDQECEVEYTNNKSVTFAALVEGIIPLFIGVSIGFLSATPYLHWLLTGGFLLAGIIAGLLFAKRKHPINFNFDTLGGFLFLSAAIKLALNFTRF